MVPCCSGQYAKMEKGWELQAVKKREVITLRERKREWDMIFLIARSGGGVCAASIMMVLMVVYGEPGQERMSPMVAVDNDVSITTMECLGHKVARLSLPVRVRLRATSMKRKIP